MAPSAGVAQQIGVLPQQLQAPPPVPGAMGPQGGPSFGGPSAGGMPFGGYGGAPFSGGGGPSGGFGAPPPAGYGGGPAPASGFTGNADYGAWGGFSNGQIPSSALRSVNGIVVAPFVAPSLNAMIAAAGNAGIDLTGGGYRPLSVQQSLYPVRRAQGIPIATPGTSVHGFGEAIDFNLNNPGAYSWLAQHGPDFGFYRIPSEAWHWQYAGGPGSRIGVNMPPPAPPPSAPMSAPAFTMPPFQPLSPGYLGPNQPTAPPRRPPSGGGRGGGGGSNSGSGGGKLRVM
jgi:hypothetical protein